MANKKSNKQRLDQLLVDRGLVESRSKARGLILAGEVSVDDQPVTKAGHGVEPDAKIRVHTAAQKFVSRAGFKLEGFLEEFPFETEGAVCLDLGASTGGFTDCLLQRGAKKVFALDVGYGQLDYKLRNDARVVVLERKNARYLQPEWFDENIDLVTIDVSFISMTKLVPGLLQVVGTTTDLVSLIKPQFEAGKAEADRGGGIIRDPQIHRRVLNEVWATLVENKWQPLAMGKAALAGVSGNQEFLIGATTTEIPRSKYQSELTRDQWTENLLE